MFYFILFIILYMCSLYIYIYNILYYIMGQAPKSAILSLRQLRGQRSQAEIRLHEHGRLGANLSLSLGFRA